MALNPDEKIFNVVTRSLPDPIFIIDEDGTYINIYGGSDRKKYHDGKMLIGKKFWDFLDHSKAETFYSKLKTALDSNETITHIYSLSIEEINNGINSKDPGPSGIMWFEAHITPLEELKNQKRMVVWVTFNITERYNLNHQLQKEKKALKKANQTKDKLFSIIAHDLINPFSSFQQMLEVIIKKYDDLDDENKKEYLKEGLKLAESNNELLQNLLNWSRVQRKRITLHIDHVNLYDLVEENMSYLDGNCKEKNIKIKNTIDPHIMVMADKNTLSLIIRNLLSNAVKFTYNKGEIKITHFKGNHNEDIVKIKDTGKGMDKETLGKLFSTDEVNSTHGTNYEKGSGLGLMLCKEFIDMHRGEIWAESAPGEGSEFFISLPGER